MRLPAPVLLLGAIFLAGTGLGAIVNEQSHHHEVETVTVTETKTVERPVILPPRTETVRAPAPPPETVYATSPSCAKVQAIAAEAIAITNRTSARTSDMVSIASELAQASFKGDVDELDASRLRLADLRAAQTTDFRRSGELDFQYNKYKGDC